MSAIGEALRAQAAALLAVADALESADRDTEPDPWVGVVSYVKGAVPARVANAACACGQVTNATKRGKRWIARRSDVDAWLSSAGQSEPRTDAQALAAEWGQS